MKKKEIIKKNSKGGLHGYQEFYSAKGWLQVRGNSKNDVDIGYQEYHGYDIDSSNNGKETIFCIS